MISDFILLKGKFQGSFAKYARGRTWKQLSCAVDGYCVSVPLPKSVLWRKCFQCPTNCVNLQEVFLHYAVFEDLNDFSKVRV